MSIANMVSVSGEGLCAQLFGMSIDELRTIQKKLNELGLTLKDLPALLDVDEVKQFAEVRCRMNQAVHGHTR